MSKGGAAITILALLALGYCATRPKSPSAEERRQRTEAFIASLPDDEEPASDDEEKPADTDSERQEDEEEEVRGGETYSQFDARRDDLHTGLYSGEDECTVDCGGHDAGRRWAERKGVTDPDDCGGKSWSFEEGCRSYAEEQQDD